MHERLLPWLTQGGIVALADLVGVRREDDEPLSHQFEAIGLIGPVDRLAHHLFFAEIALPGTLVCGKNGGVGRLCVGAGNQQIGRDPLARFAVVGELDLGVRGILAAP